MNEILHLGWWICGSRVGCCCPSGPRTAAACSPPHYSPRFFFFSWIEKCVNIAPPAGHITANWNASKWMSFLSQPILLHFLWRMMSNKKSENNKFQWKAQNQTNKTADSKLYLLSLLLAIKVQEKQFHPSLTAHCRRQDDWDGRGTRPRWKFYLL